MRPRFGLVRIGRWVESRRGGKQGCVMAFTVDRSRSIISAMILGRKVTAMDVAWLRREVFADGAVSREGADSCASINALAALVNVLGEAHRAPRWFLDAVRARARQNWLGVDDAFSAAAG